MIYGMQMGFFSFDPKNPPRLNDDDVTSVATNEEADPPGVRFQGMSGRNREVKAERFMSRGEDRASRSPFGWNQKPRRKFLESRSTIRLDLAPKDLPPEEAAKTDAYARRLRNREARKSRKAV